MVCQQEDGIGQSITAGGNQPAVAAGAKILAGKKAESAGQAHAAGLSTVNGGAETLGAVLDQNQVMIVGNALQGVHVGRLAKQVNRQNGARAFGDRCPNPVGVDIEAACIHIDKHRRGAHIGDGLGGGNKGKRRGNDLIARADAGSAQGQMQRIGSRRTAYGVAYAQPFGQLLFKRADVGPQNEPCSAHDGAYRITTRRLQTLVTGAQLHHGYGLHACLLRATGDPDSTMSRMRMAISSARAPSSPLTTTGAPSRTEATKASISRMSGS